MELTNSELGSNNVIDDAKAYRWLLSQGAANAKKGGLCISESNLKASVVFRYWDLSESEVDNMIKKQMNKS